MMLLVLQQALVSSQDTKVVMLALAVMLVLAAKLNQ